MKAKQILSLYNVLVTIHKRGLPGQFPGCFWSFLWPSRTGPGGTPSGSRVTFNSNLNRAPAKNKPRIEPVSCPAGTRRGPCRDPPGTRGQILKESTQGTRPDPLYGTREGTCGVLTRLVGYPGGVLPVPLRCPNGSRSGPFNNL